MEDAGRHWDEMARRCMREVAAEVRRAVTEVTNASGQVPTVLGDEGTLDERLAEFRACVRAGSPVVSVSATGSFSRWLAARDTMAISLSTFTFIPEQPGAPPRSPPRPLSCRTAQAPGA